MSGHKRYRCLGCGAWFGETEGTPLYRLRTPPEEIAKALLLVMRRGSLRAAEEGTGYNYETIGHWLHLAARHAERLEEHTSELQSHSDLVCRLLLGNRKHRCQNSSNSDDGSRLLLVGAKPVQSQTRRNLSLW